MFRTPTTLCPVVMATPEASLCVTLKRPPELKSLPTAVLQERSLKQREYLDDCVQPGRPRTPPGSPLRPPVAPGPMSDADIVTPA